MPANPSRSLRCLVALAAALGFLAAPAGAEDEAPEVVAPADLPLNVDVELADLEEIEKQRKVIQARDRIGQRVSRYLERAGELAEQEQTEEAKALLEKIQESRLNGFEKAYVLRLMGFVAYGASQPEQAIDYFGQAVATESLPLRDENTLRYGIGQLYVGTGSWVEAIYAFKDWLRYSENPDPTGYFVQAIAYFQLKKFDTAIAHVQKALEVAPKPQESWLKLLAALYAEKQEFKNAVPVLEELLVRFPSKTYWTQLALINAATESYDVSLAVQQIAYEQGYVSEQRELLRLAQGYVFHGLPYPAAKLIERELESGRLESSAEHHEMLANSWIGAREYDKALPPLHKAAKLADTGTFYVRLGQVHMQREEWSEAVDFLRKAIAKADLEEKQGSAQVLLGIALYNAGELVGAQSSFAQASRYERNRAEAERWLEHIGKELAQGA